MKLRKLTAWVLILTMLLGLIPAALAIGDGLPEPNDSYCTRSILGTHSWGAWETTREPTCTRSGTQRRTCRNGCGYAQTREIPKTGHSWDKWKTTREATCSERGEETRQCGVCGQKETRRTDRLPHSYGEWTVTLQPTDHSAGERLRTCAVCGAEDAGTFDPEGTLRRGDRGDAVRALQEGLICYGALTGRADGEFGRGTESAVKKVQEAEGLTWTAWPGLRRRRCSATVSAHGRRSPSAPIFPRACVGAPASAAAIVKRKRIGPSRCSGAGTRARA